MEPSDLIGKSEGPQLEFKRAAALERPEIIGREVVAMLNTRRGGDIWIGFTEQGSVAFGIDPVPDAEQAVRRLLDHLVDTIEPTPAGDEVRVEVIEAGTAGKVLRIRVKPVVAKSPYAQASGASRTFVMRTGERIVRMSREELRERFRAHGAVEDRVAAATTLLERLHDKRARDLADTLWVCVHPTPDLDLDLDAPDLELLLREPTRSGNRETGWNFTWATEGMKRQSSRVSFGQRGDRMLELQRSGAIEFSVPVQRLFWGRNAPPASKSDREIHPWALCEYGTSVLRLAGRLYEGRVQRAENDDETDAIIALALLSAPGVTLRPYSFLSADFAAARPQPLEGDDLLLELPLVVRAQRLIDEPDRCGFLLMQRVYECFGYEERHLPSEFDRKTGRLGLPR